MTTDREGSEARRRYLLGTASEDESTAIERQYFADEPAGDQVATDEAALIEEYLGGRLDSGDREQFERLYLASPQHRLRVATIRQLMAAAPASRSFGASRPGPFARGQTYRWLAAAAALVVVIAGVALLDRPSVPPSEPAAPGPVAPQAGLRTLAMSLSPLGVRSAGETQSLRIPAATDVVMLRLEGEGSPLAGANAHVAIRLVSGEEVWRGTGTLVAGLPAGVVAEVAVPAARLSADDYVLVLFEADASGIERERDRYFLRVFTSTPPG